MSEYVPGPDGEPTDPDDYDHNPGGCIECEYRCDGACQCTCHFGNPYEHWQEGKL